MACKQITLWGANQKFVVPCVSYSDLLMHMAINLDIDPMAHSLIFSTQKREFTITLKLYQMLIAEASEANLKIIKSQSDRPGFQMILEYYKQNSQAMHKSLKKLYANYICYDASDIIEISLNRKMFTQTDRHLLIILPFLKYLKKIHAGISVLSKYSINFCRGEIIGQRSNNLQTRLDLLDLSHVDLLNYISITNLAGIFSCLPNLEVLDFSDTNLIGCEAIFYSISPLILRGLNLSGCSRLNFIMIFEILSEYKNLEVLELNYCELNMNHIASLKKFTDIGKYSNLKTFSIRNNSFSSCNEIVYSMGAMNKLEKIDISNCNFSTNHFITLTYSLVACIKLTHLYISDTKLFKAIQPFCQLLNYLPNLRYLDISKNRLTDKEIIAVLQLSRNLILLDATDNIFTPRIISFLPSTLNYLYLGLMQDISALNLGNLIELVIEFSESTSASSLLDSIRNQRNLKLLGLKNLAISQSNAEILLKIIRNSRELEIIELYEACCDFSTLEQLSKAFVLSKSLRLFGFNHSQLSREKLYQICKIQLRNDYFRFTENFAFLKKSDLCKKKSRCPLCYKYCIFTDLCEWARMRYFTISRITNYRTLV